MNYIRHLNTFFTLVRHDNDLTAAHVSLYMAIFQCWNINRFKNPFPIQRTNMMQLSKIGSKNTYHRCMKELHAVGYIKLHVQASKFQPISISVHRLDKLEVKVEESESVADQPLKDHERIGGQCTENDTGTVSELVQVSLQNGTGKVPESVLSLKQANIQTGKTVLATPTTIFEKNRDLSEAINVLARVSETVHRQVQIGYSNSSANRVEVVRPTPTKSEVETFFQDNRYPLPEARKFFYYNHGKGWMLTSTIPIKDWQSLAHKWMLNQHPPKKPHEKSPHQFSPDKNYSEPL